MSAYSRQNPSAKAVGRSILRPIAKNRRNTPSRAHWLCRAAAGSASECREWVRFCPSLRSLPVSVNAGWEGQKPAQKETFPCRLLRKSSRHRCGADPIRVPTLPRPKKLNRRPAPEPSARPCPPGGWAHWCSFDPIGAKHPKLTAALSRRCPGSVALPIRRGAGSVVEPAGAFR